MISYPFIEGGHSPSNSLQIISLLQKLIHFHSENYVLTDIRGSNIVFGKENDDAFFIDFDYCGKVGKIRYPENFDVTNITDEKRHSEVKAGGPVQRRHDCFSSAEH
jgi:serine/threonine protein kinase